MTVLRIQVPSPPRKASKLEIKYRTLSRSCSQSSFPSNGSDGQSSQTVLCHRVAITTPSPVRFPLKRRTLQHRRQQLSIISDRGHNRAIKKSVPIVSPSEGLGGMTFRIKTKPEQTYTNTDIVSIAGARSVSIPIKFKVERSPSPTSSMMDIDSNSDGDINEAETPHEPKKDRHHGVQFIDRVCVTEIPNRNSYTSEQKQQMWNNSATIRSMAQRNMFEYNWEGRNWRQAMEEESFFEYYGSLIHPAHYQTVTCQNNAAPSQISPLTGSNIENTL